MEVDNDGNEKSRSIVSSAIKTKDFVVFTGNRTRSVDENLHVHQDKVHILSSLLDCTVLYWMMKT